MKTLVVGLRERIERARPTVDPGLAIEQADLLPVESLGPLLADKEILLTAPSLPVTRELLAAAPALRFIQVPSAGFEKIDLDAARERGIPVANAAGNNATTVAEHVFMVALALQRHLFECHQGIQTGQYTPVKGQLMAGGLFELAGKTLGIVGLGRVGKQVARRAMGFDLRTLYYDIVRPTPEEERALGVTFTPLDDLLRQADVLTVHVPLQADTFHLIGERELSKLKPSAIVINAARGPLVDPAPLASMIADGLLAGAAVDVFETEPAPDHDPLIRLAMSGHPRILLTPHLAGVTAESTVRGLQIAFDNVARFARGEAPINVVNEVASGAASA